MDRAKIKEQAKTLMRGKVFSLFLIALVVSLVISLPTMSFDVTKTVSKLLNGFQSVTTAINFPFLSVFGIFLAPLTVVLSGYFVSFIRNNQDGDIGHGLTYVFKNAFSKNYFQYLVTSLLRNVIIILGVCLFIIPGIIFGFSYFFVEEIICDNPNLTAVNALKLSKKITNGYKTDLFVLMLSFIGQIFLVAITFGIYSIYYIPYFSTVKALYYENFKQRAIFTGVATPEEFGNYPQPPVGDGTYQSPQSNGQNPPSNNQQPTQTIIPEIIQNENDINQ